ncbi:PspC domain-containing protein [Cellulosimicrobium cellulans]|uniref:PspC domain-containing protein n=1 Tax=Cellulosimicrobium cellulans TaxID=1710 RepID=UPI0020973744|nr:ATP-binding protein [Cellulosimicrobium cellulans]MCO7272611.1 PspC domain-containing protein [Cellulosimicrobium cellulans]
MTTPARPGPRPGAPTGAGPGSRPRGLPLRRPERGRWVAGVCAGLAAHLGVSVGVVRLVMALLGLAGGAGVALYVFWWLTVPSGDPAAARDEQRPASLSRLAPRLQGSVRRLPVRDVAIGVVLLGGAALLVALRTGVDVEVSWVIPVLIALVGAALAWSQLDAVERGRLLTRAGGRTPAGVLRIAGGVVLVLVGIVLLVGQDARPTQIVRAAVAAVAVLAGVAIVLAPWWLKLVRELGDERAARAREAERADIAAHLHDSVLQTLALIRARSSDADTVARLARAQERELREWLYDDRPSPGTSLAAELRGLVAEVEDGRVGRRAEPIGAPVGAPGGSTGETDPGPVVVDVVVVGDCTPTQETAALLQATREALVNAVAHGGPPYSVYLEVSDAAVEVFVRDRGDGFDMEDVAPDRFGVRESILGRVQRRGGKAEIISRPGWGTEVRLRVPRALTAEPEPARPPSSAPSNQETP